MITKFGQTLNYEPISISLVDVLNQVRALPDDQLNNLISRLIISERINDELVEAEIEYVQVVNSIVSKVDQVIDLSTIDFSDLYDLGNVEISELVTRAISLESQFPYFKKYRGLTVDPNTYDPYEVTDADIDQWRREHYAELRKACYPDPAIYLDAVAKGDQAQMDLYSALCQAVKNRFPKPA